MKRTTQKLGTLLLGTAILAVSVISSCSKSSSGSSKPKPPTNPGGYDSSAQIASANLIAYFPFNGSYNDVKSGLTGTNHGAAFASGVKGQAYSGSGNSYVAFNTVGPLASISSYTLSAWFKIAAQPVNNTTSAYIPGQGAQGMFSLYDTVTGNPNLLLLELEPYTPVSMDSVRFHAGFNNTGNTAGAGWQAIIPEGFADTAVGKWTQVVMTYDGASSTYTLYENGVAITAATAWGKNPTPTVIYNGPTGGSTTGPMGNIHFKNPPTGFIIGAWPFTAGVSSGFQPQPWSGNLQGAMDELRIYNSALNSSDVKSLYILEKSGF
jgi:hypothetical protein